MGSQRIITITEVEGVIITVFDIKGENYLQFEIPRRFTGPLFDDWWVRNRDTLSRLKTAKEWDT